MLETLERPSAALAVVEALLRLWLLGEEPALALSGLTTLKAPLLLGWPLGSSEGEAEALCEAKEFFLARGEGAAPAAAAAAAAVATPRGD